MLEKVLDRQAQMNGAESVVRTLVEADVEVCFANPGTSEIHFVASLDRETGLRPILCLFEGVATGAADGYGRMAGKPAADAASSRGGSRERSRQSPQRAAGANADRQSRRRPRDFSRPLSGFAARLGHRGLRSPGVRLAASHGQRHDRGRRRRPRGAGSPAAAGADRDPDRPGRCGMGRGRSSRIRPAATAHGDRGRVDDCRGRRVAEEGPEDRNAACAARPSGNAA